MKRMVVALQSPGSRRSVAPYRLCAPPPPLYSPALPRGCNRPPGPRSAAAPSDDLHPLPSAPLGLPLCLWVAVTRPPLCSGRDTAPWFAPSPSKPLSRTPGRRTVPPCRRDRPVGREILNLHRKEMRMGVNGDCADIEIESFSHEIEVSAFCLFPRSRRSVA